eukprot:CAMPEP_0184976078 /NCGR_PEP_ID=MMETSP1098-20130426/7104_1 /TAXON_ID=89044 /ORGANISM="Spumella elongata, Strain CCAP 955/1" /LENGTH=287 /DNA_ID=CAMNT_0027498875 /DNA_START=56 /DNA_END=916 /DNA_ORIENTATION=+
MTHTFHGNLWVLIGLYVGNFFYSVSKRSLNVSFPLLKTQMGATNAHMGDMSSEFSFAYGVSKLLGGVLSDLFPSYALFTIGLYIGAIVNLCIAGASSISSIGFLWMLNGLGQGPGGPALSRLVIEHWPAKSRASVWSSLTFACNLGYLLSTAAMTPYLVFGWQGPFVSVGIASLASSVLMSVMYVLFLRHPSEKDETETIKEPADETVVNVNESKDQSGSIEEVVAHESASTTTNENGSVKKRRTIRKEDAATDPDQSNAKISAFAPTSSTPKEVWYTKIMNDVRNT